MTLRIVADENMPFAAEHFGRLGEVTLLAGRRITADDVRDADLLMVRSVTRVNRELLAGSRVRSSARRRSGRTMSIWITCGKAESGLPRRRGAMRNRWRSMSPRRWRSRRGGWGCG